MAVAPIRLPRLPQSVGFTDPKTGQPTKRGQQWWQSAMQQIEAGVNGVIEAQTAATAAQAAAVAAQTAADTAQAAADAAQAAADAIVVPPADTRTVTASTAVTGTDSTINVDATAGTVIVTLLSAASPYPVTIKKIDATANIVRIAAQGGETINGAATFDFTTPSEYHYCTSNGLDEWYA